LSLSSPQQDLKFGVAEEEEEKEARERTWKIAD